MSKKQKQVANPTDQKTLRVEWGNVSIGDGTARLGMKIDRTAIEVQEADETLCGRRLTGRAVVCSPDDDPAQAKLFEGCNHEVTATFDVKGFGCRPTCITAGLTFSLADVDVSELSQFARKSGALVIDGCEPIPDDEPEGGATQPADFGDNGNDLARTADRVARGKDALATADSDEWRKAPLFACGITGKTAEKLHAVHIDTLGKLQDLMQKHGAWWFKEVKGIGEQTAEKIGELFNAYIMRHAKSQE